MCRLVWPICIKWSVRESDNEVRMTQWDVCASSELLQQDNHSTVSDTLDRKLRMEVRFVLFGKRY